ncbi:GNAT family N-acetyltransferase [Alteromonas oceanisediminis]|uniref:GNAT family N-acetyltransferase n=1 Tax=Alteromonas oceanisediminis TaxID=2836180 RepID=UPI001BDAD033|nr:GNAT family protein [Alteromonas oceanisediminis]MBT0585472.1 GNAT family N-acetyltransferase [Alteromonas oceanisediminis]
MNKVALTRITRAHKADLKALSESARSSVEPWLGTFFTPIDSGECEAFLTWCELGLKQRSHHCFLILAGTDKSAHEYVGVGFLNAINSVHQFCNLGYWIAPAFCGKGLATMAANQLLTFAVEQLGLRRVELVIEPANVSSLAIAQKVGCVNEGLLRSRIFGRDAFMFAYVPSSK